MCTILNVGLTAEIRKSLAAKCGDAFASSIYRRFLVNSLVALEKDPGSEASIEVAEQLVKNELGAGFLTDPFEQLIRSVELVFASSRSKNVKDYLKELSIDVIYGTAVTIQQMVLGNMNARCMSGVLFTRNPINGDDEMFGEYREMTQGEDVVMGNIVTRNIATIAENIKAELLSYKRILEQELKHELDIEFTVEDDRLYLLQTRRATISTYAKLVVDVDMMKNGIISLEEFRKRIERMCATNAFISVPRADDGFREWKPPLIAGVPINHGIACGTLVLTLEKLEEIKAHRENIIYFAQNTKPSDFYIMNNAHGIITVYPGRTSHAAITSITLNKLLENGATPILCSHLGEPDKQEKKGKSREEIYAEYSLKPVAEYLRTQLGDLVFHEKSIASSGVLIKKEDIIKGKINIIENLRYAIGEKENDLFFARGLAGLSDSIYVNDAFGTSHRSHASITGVTRHVGMKLAGMLVEKELNAKTVLWNGPIGAFEIKEGSAGTIKLSLAKMAEKGKTVIIGGGDSAAAVKMAGVADKMTHVSTGGGASLEFLERLTLPGISVLDSD